MKFVDDDDDDDDSGPAAWNTLPSDLHNTDTSTFRNDLRVYFLIVLKTDYCWRSWACRIAAPYKLID